MARYTHRASSGTEPALFETVPWFDSTGRRLYEPGHPGHGLLIERVVGSAWGAPQLFGGEGLRAWTSTVVGAGAVRVYRREVKASDESEDRDETTAETIRNLQAEVKRFSENWSGAISDAEQARESARKAEKYARDLVYARDYWQRKVRELEALAGQIGEQTSWRVARQIRDQIMRRLAIHTPGPVPASPTGSWTDVENVDEVRQGQSPFPHVPVNSSND